MNAREKQLPLRNDPVPLPRSPSNVQLPATKTDPKPDLMSCLHTTVAYRHTPLIHETITVVNPSSGAAPSGCRLLDRDRRLDRLSALSERPSVGFALNVSFAVVLDQLTALQAAQEA